MRSTLLLLPLLTACALPDFDVPETEAAQSRDWPELIPFGDVTGRAADMPEPDPDLAPDLDERASTLRDRAGEIGADTATDTDADRAARLRQRADDLR